MVDIPIQSAVPALFAFVFARLEAHWKPVAALIAAVMFVFGLQVLMEDECPAGSRCVCGPGQLENHPEEPIDGAGDGPIRFVIPQMATTYTESTTISLCRPAPQSIR